MKLLQHTRKLLTTLTLAFVFTTTITLGAALYQHDWAVASSLKITTTHSQATLAAANLEERTRAAGKNIQGKAQETRGEITGDPGDRAAGKARQAEGQARDAAQDVGDSGAGLGERIGAAAKNIQGKAQETVGNITGDPENQAAGKAKQAEGNVRNTVEDVKDRA